ncbi:MAG: hypothetical protein J2P45_01110 [Candidatus Dormibacteraeota bacterium]|nr:hypothetical protein [Candidatus Dormibacteraeota bacterium]
MSERVRQDVGRTILVIDDRPYLWAALSARIDRGTGYVRSATPSQLSSVWGGCRPWPWLVVGATERLPEGLSGLLDGNPIPVYWCGPVPAGIPGRPAVFDDWQGLVDALGRLCEVSFNGVRLLRNRGLMGPEGEAVTGLPEVEGLLAAPDLRLAATVEVARIRRELQDHRLPVDLEAGDGYVGLVPR